MYYKILSSLYEFRQQVGPITDSNLKTKTDAKLLYTLYIARVHIISIQPNTYYSLAIINVCTVINASLVSICVRADTTVKRVTLESRKHISIHIIHKSQAMTQVITQPSAYKHCLQHKYKT